MAANHLADLASIIDDLDRAGRIAHVTSEVSLEHDLAGIAANLEGGHQAVMFDNVKGHSAPVFTGLYWSRDLLGHLMRKAPDELPQYVSDSIGNWQQSPMPPVLVDDGPVLQGESGLTLDDIPIPVHAAKDGGPYFDAGVVIATDPETGVRNASIQRFMVVDERTLHVNIDAGRHLGLYLEKARQLKKSLFISINCGVGPGLHFAAATPAEAAPPDTDELGIASEFHGAPLELVKGRMTPSELVANAMYAIECEMIPGELGDEGPFAEVTGYYARREPRPKVRVRAVHARQNPVFQTIISGAEVWNSVGLLGEANVLATLQRQVPGVQDVYFTHGGCGFYHAVVSLSQKRAGWGKQAIMAAFAAFPPLKMVTVVDDDVDIRDASDVEWSMATRLDPKTGILTIDKVFGHGLNPGFPDYLGSKVGFDCTRPFPYTYEYDRAAYKPVDMSDVVISNTASLSASGAAPSALDTPAIASFAQTDSSSIGAESATTGAQRGLLIAHVGADVNDGSAAELMLDLEARFVGSELLVDVERMRTTTELRAWLKANKGVYSHVLLIADGTRHGIRFLDRKKAVRGAKLAKQLPKKGGTVEILCCCSVGERDKFAASLSRGAAVKDVIIIDPGIDPQWQAHLAAGYFLCLQNGDATEAAVRRAMPVGIPVQADIWRDGQLSARVESER
jgi:2,5-furandicarboxylate decarboxylase 1